MGNLFKYQYAIGKPNGAKFVGYTLRQAFQKGKALVKMDLSNAYNVTLRKYVQQLLKDNNINLDLQSYFHVTYSADKKLAVYGPHGRVDVIEMKEGLTQGESSSSQFFCLVMEQVCRLIKEEFPNDNDVEIYCYMDDNSIICDRKIVRKVIDCAIKAARKCGFTVNLEKSSVICKNGIPEPDEDDANLEMVTIDDPNSEFRILGVNITDSFEQYNDSIVKRIDRFFNSLELINLHPELKHLLLNFCGKPRLLYYCETTPPEFGRAVVNHFQNRMKAAFASLIGIKDLSLIRDSMLYNANGGNLPDYASNYDDIYNRTLIAIQHGDMRTTMVKLIGESLEEFTSPECSHDRLWSQYTAATTVQQLSVSHYKTALAIRCKLIPECLKQDLDRTVRCGCNQLVSLRNHTPQQELDMQEAGNVITPILPHIIKCPHLHRVHYVDRHDFVKNAIRYVANRYGIRTHVEPTFYHYASGQHNRPDITFCIQNRPYVAIDITVVQPVDSTDISAIGNAASLAAKEKVNKHQAAVSQMNHRFIPFALETTGHMDVGCFLLFNTLKHSVPFASRVHFMRDMRGAVSTAMAQYRATVLLATLTNIRTRN